MYKKNFLKEGTCNMNVQYEFNVATNDNPMEHLTIYLLRKTKKGGPLFAGHRVSLHGQRFVDT